ncbi:MAG: hypothetical protein FWE17_00075 [Alphaproteobacteria bacterium]|nr:hypothetical protein [Alphaproteobacteria bacterium]MCL2757902.1 hypothetical protein [Alphaproteobacteria bacterium]
MLKKQKFLYALIVATGYWLLATGYPVHAETPVPADSGGAIESFDPNLAGNRHAPVRSWRHGWQFGLGVPVASPLPLSSINGFVGFVDKNQRGFWQKRFGWRADFAIPSSFEMRGAIKDDNLDLSGRLLGFRQSRTVKDVADFDLEDDRGPIDVHTDGISGAFIMRNQYLGGLVDFYPFGNTWFLGGLRFSGGYYFGSADLRLQARVPNYFPNKEGYAYLAADADDPADRVFINARMMKNTQVGTRLRWNYRGPYAGFGWDMGIWRGFKFFTDMGVVFANAPHMRNGDIDIPAGRFEACIVDPTHGTTCEDNEWVPINITDPQGTLSGILTAVLTNFADGVFAGTPIGTLPPGMDVGGTVDCFLFGGAKHCTGIDSAWLDWVETLAEGDNQLGDIMNQMKDGAAGIGDFDLQNLTNRYLDARRDTRRDINDVLKDIKYVPMIRLGFMYRF